MLSALVPCKSGGNPGVLTLHSVTIVPDESHAATHSQAVEAAANAVKHPCWNNES
jgi:hypothetical protein